MIAAFLQTRLHGTAATAVHVWRFAILALGFVVVARIVRLAVYRRRLVASDPHLENVLMSVPATLGWLLAVVYIIGSVADRLTSDLFSWRAPLATAALVLCTVGIRHGLHLNWSGRPHRE